MNDRLSVVLDERDIPHVDNEIWRSVQQVVASAIFAKSPRMCELLSFLVSKKISGREHEINEYAIGLDVFRRDARVYDTALDPVVRVQIGRLRGRLAAYYAQARTPPALQITIPPGYVPLFGEAAMSRPDLRHTRLQLGALRDLSCGQDHHAFICGVDEELRLKLFQSFGRALKLSESAPNDAPPGVVNLHPLYRLEGSVRVEAHHVRAAVRLVDTDTGHIVWLSQFDSCGELGMSLQEELATSICEALRRHLADG
jgi:hypothetical protein